MNMFIDIHILSAERALMIYNALGITLPIVIIMANSHGMEVDEVRFNELLQDQESRIRKSCYKQEVCDG
jgi:alanyl-tRNA synthetase